ncbi:hypothetical protein Ga0609869_000751 [Rhodovulum iodosum]|uniref:DUF1523 family protein n=1 Tax=Rhodovulum iodosum TaxID=68291 RepID=A0ABV3XPZ8_9RHOB|nr:DUF1523 family protein [Rhodovulum robiginosum]RSK31325.1 DUF1523 family protein [Rhodovulum robiginosum]
MVYVKWTFYLLIGVLVFSFFHYTLPQHDVVRITNTEVRRVDFGDYPIFWSDAAPGTEQGGTNRDVRFIETFRPNGKPSIYRNEDTGWSWPPYFKVDSSDLQAEAGNLVSTKDNPEWVVITHYGWRVQYLSTYPNAVTIKPVAGPDVRIIPWVNIIILSVLGLIALWLWRLWSRFHENRIEPLLENAEEAWENVDQRAEGFFQRLFRRR